MELKRPEVHKYTYNAFPHPAYDKSEMNSFLSQVADELEKIIKKRFRAERLIEDAKSSDTKAGALDLYDECCEMEYELIKKLRGE